MKKTTLAVLAIALLTSCQGRQAGPDQATSGHGLAQRNALFLDTSGGDDWPAYGRTYGEQHFSPLTDINAGNVAQLGLAWAMDLPPGNPATIPVEVNGVLYFASGYSVVHAVDVVTGKLLWTYDPKAAEAAGPKLRQGWGSRGIAYWNGKVYTGTADGRLIAIDAKTGNPVWSVMTVDPKDGRFITGAPRVFDGKIMIGHGGADSASIRGYVTTYDAETGKQLWRFYTVPGDPSKGFEDPAQKMAAATWYGEWWKFGGGGNVWNAITYDPETDTVFIGTGNGAPWNRKVRSEGKGDNLFLCSIVALNAKTGAYKWHYQVNPGDTTDYNASMDIELADLRIGGQVRKVLMQAPKNGFFYVIDRLTGKLISAEKIAKVTWATKIDLATGRPVEVPGSRFPNGQKFELWPSFRGAHSWMPMAFNPGTGLVYIPKIEMGALHWDYPPDLKNWHRTPGFGQDMGVAVDAHLTDPMQNTSSLLAWDPVTQKRAWEVKTIGGWNGGIMTTAGNLVFQGQLNGRFSAYSADHGKEIWHFATQAPVISAPITYRFNGKQYVTVIVGMGSSAVTDHDSLGGVSIDYRTQLRRVLTFALDGKAQLPAAPPAQPLVPVDDPDYKDVAQLAATGAGLYAQHCIVCHGVDAAAAGGAPDLRTSAAIVSADTFRAIVHDGGLVPNGMPQFDDLSDDQLAAIRQYLRSRAAAMRGKAN